MLMRAAVDFAALRAREFARLDATSCTYLDYAGAALYPRSLVFSDARRLATRVMGNPHSESEPSRTTTEAMEAARGLTLELLDADPRDYDVVFTANASGALRIVAEAFPFRRGSRLVLTADNHNSVNGIRVRARRRGATVAYTPLDDELRGIDPAPSLTPTGSPSLFAFPAQSNFSGVRHPLAWAAAPQAQGYRVLLDAAAYVPTSRLSLTDTPADFVVLSFYKMFGYPTGVGALVARREAMSSLRRSYFGGGTVQFASVRIAAPDYRKGPRRSRMARQLPGHACRVGWPEVARRDRYRSDRRSRRTTHGVAARPIGIVGPPRHRLRGPRDDGPRRHRRVQRHP